MFIDNRYVSKGSWYDRDGKPFQPGGHCYVGGATKMHGAALANAAKPLHQSANNKYPRGLAHGLDQVGRNYMFRNSAAVLAVSRHHVGARLQLQGARARQPLRRRRELLPDPRGESRIDGDANGLCAGDYLLQRLK